MFWCIHVQDYIQGTFQGIGLWECAEHAKEMFQSLNFDLKLETFGSMQERKI